MKSAASARSLFARRQIRRRGLRDIEIAGELRLELGGVDLGGGAEEGVEKALARGRGAANARRSIPPQGLAFPPLSFSVAR